MINEINPNAQAYFAYKAINYLGGEPAEKDFSIIGSAKDAVGTLPVGIALTQAPQAFGFARGKNLADGAKGFKGIKTGYGAIKNGASGAAEVLGLAKKGAVTDLFKKGGLGNAYRNFETVEAATKVSKAAAETVKKGSKIGRLVGKIPVVGKKLTALGAKFGGTKLGALCKKGNAGFIAVIDGVMETFTQVVPAFKNGGFKEGMKQLGKSAVKVGASTLGFVAGEAGGKAIGSAIGTAICPGVGTLIGGIVGGLVGGIFGSSVAGGIAKKVTGKSYSEKTSENEKQKMAQQAAQDSTSMQMLRTETLQRLNAKQQSGQALTTEEQELLQYIQPNQGSATTYKTPSGAYDYRTDAFKASQAGSFSAVA